MIKALNIDALNSPIKWWSGWIKFFLKDSTLCYLQETHFSFKDI